MKRVVSVSLGSRSRDYAIDVELLGEQVRIERIGTDGDGAAARRLFQELDGVVDCLGVGGATLYFDAPTRSYPLSAVHKLVEQVHTTPVVDGGHFKNVMERRMAQAIIEELGAQLPGRNVLLTSGVDRLGLALSFVEQDFVPVFGDLMFALGLPLPLHSLKALDRVANTLGPVLRHLPMSWLYPTGQKEDETRPRFTRWFRWAHVIAGDCNYITNAMPTDLAGKIIATNTTTEHDVQRFRERGVSHLVTSTPRLGTRSFGTNLMEGVLVALAGEGRVLDDDEVRTMLDRLGWHPNIEKLN